MASSIQPLDPSEVITMTEPLPDHDTGSLHPPARPNGHHTTDPSTTASPSTPANHATEPATKTPYQIVEEPSRVNHRIKIIVIGAGASALNFARETDISPLDIELVCYEKNEEIGGTWYENRYPGCACDVPSVCYQYSWAPSTKWSSYYSPASEILQYFKDLAERHDLMKYVKLKHKVVGAWWMEETNQWKVKVQRPGGDVVENLCHILINASGVLNKWKWPAIPGRETFEGTMMHSANWDEKVELKGKSVALIGCGSSAVQILPSILPEVKQVKNFIRSQYWVTAGFASNFASKNGTNFKYSAEQKKMLDEDATLYLRYRKNIESELNIRFKFMINGSPEQAAAREFATNEMRKKLASKPEIADAIIPTNFGVGCRRPTPGEGYLEALCAENVDVITDDISEITPKGIRTQDGVEHELDIIICATGFDVSWKPPYPTIGRDGRSLSEEWRETPSTYLSVGVPHFPNYLILNGPFGPYAHGSFLPIIELLSKYFMQIIEKMSHEQMVSFEPSEEATADFEEHRRTFLPRTAWSMPCRSWFKQGSVDGEVMMWPGSRVHFFETMKRVRWEDYKIKTRDRNRFSYMGNGFAAREFDGRDLSWYLGLLDGKDQQPDFSRDDIRMFLDG